MTDNEQWSKSNQAWCEFFHRKKFLYKPEPLTKQEREEMFFTSEHWGRYVKRMQQRNHTT